MKINLDDIGGADEQPKKPSAQSSDFADLGLVFVGHSATQ